MELDSQACPFLFMYINIVLAPPSDDAVRISRFADSVSGGSVMGGG